MAATVRGNASDEGFRRLLELETEYRTQRLADQLHAIASYPHLFDEFPYPVLINSAILKIADYFRNSVLGCMATIVSDRIDVYHNVIHSLDSSEAMEVSAAIYAADMIGAQSQRFCAIVSGKLAFMVRDTKTPLPLRRRLIRIFGHMFEDITLARLARKTCLDILELNQDGEYTVAILRTLTRLASHSLVDVDQQIALLVQRAQDQSNSHLGTRRVALMCLGLLAQRSIEFSPEQIKAKCRDERTVLRAMSTLDKVFRLTGVLTSISLADFGTQTINDYIQATLQILDRSFSTFSSTPPSSRLAAGSKLVVLECYSLLSVILSSYQPMDETESLDNADQTFKDAIKSVTQSMERFLERIWSQGSKQSEGGGQGGVMSSKVDQAKPVLWFLVSLTLREGSAVDVLLMTILRWIDTYKDSSALLAKALLHIARQRPKKVYQLQDIIITHLENHINFPDTDTFTLVYRALLEFSTLNHTSAASSATEAFESRVSLLLEQFGQVDMMEQYTRNHWELYQLARYSLQSGWSSLALVALRNQEKSLTSVSAALWVMVVQTVALIESSLQTAAASASAGENRGRLDLYSQQQMYIKVMGYLEELEAHQVNRAFHLQFCSLRRSYLQTCQSAAATLHLLSTSLLTERQRRQYQTTTTSMLTLAGDEVALYRCADKFNRLAHQYTVLRDSVVVEPMSDSSIFMATSTTTTTTATAAAAAATPQTKALKKSQHSDGAIEVLQTMCLVIAYVIQRVAKILDRASSSNSIIATGDQQQPQEDEEDVFDIDPLLMPLLYLRRKDGHDRIGRDSGTFLDVFRASTQLTLAYMDDHLHGADVDALEVNR
ncbi:hypothetical protein BGZ65_004910 [Modicella reniformis]|uniref:Integrator complex subunit 7 N-terminal domain-containing protein n=1 Tax=Modicella reniformis TaxID=1440133 RepID=A0A9P6J8V0_9FUNG|nr:hypothetical protein BGZ65_004910 [Modicella reniformis]